MTSKALVTDFLAQRKLALVGASRKGKKFGNAIFKELQAKGYEVFLVHPEAKEIAGVRCWPNLLSLPEPVGGVVIAVRPQETEKVLRDTVKAGIARVWMQQGSGSKTAIRFCQEQGISAIHGECILMFLEPLAFVHRVHLWLWSLLGKLPR